MTIWILALLLFVGLAAVGFTQGAIRVLFSFVGLILAALLAVPLAPWVKPVFTPFGVKHPVVLTALGTFLAFVLVLILAKVAGFAVHRKVEVYYKYKAGDLRLALWQRLNSRLGACLGLLNATVYLVIIGLVIWMVSYWTVQLSLGEGDSFLVRLVNRAGRDLQQTGMARAVRTLDPLPKTYYDAADLAGLIFRNRLLQARLARYPAFLGLAERPEFQDLAKDTAFQEKFLSAVSLQELLQEPKVRDLVNNTELHQQIWSLVGDNLEDLRTYLETGQSPRYANELILGRWIFDPNGTLNALKRARPTITSSQLLALRKSVLALMTQTSFVASADHQAFLKNAIRYKPGATQPGQLEPRTFRGKWERAGDAYQLTFEGDDSLEGSVAGERLTLSGDWMALVFLRED